MVKTAILVPLLGRPEFTERFLEFNNLINAKETFYLADGSKKKIFSQSFLQKKYPNIKIIYKKYPFDKNFSFFTNKMNRIIKEIREDYIMQIANDDFYNILFINKAEKFLINNPSYSLVGGLVKNVRIIQLFKLINDFGRIYVQKGIQYSNYGDISKDINYKNKDKRIFDFLSTLPYECLIRKTTVAKIWKLAKKFRVRNGGELNWFYNIVPLIDGKKKHFKMISQIRQNNTYNGLGVSDILAEGTSRDRYYKFLELINKQNMIKTKSVLEKMKKVADNSIDVTSSNNDLNLKKIWFPYYFQFKIFILKLNSIFFFPFLFFVKNKYKNLFTKIKILFNINK